MKNRPQKTLKISLPKRAKDIRSENQNWLGYYEFTVQKDGKDYAELDVNGYTGQVWFENWQEPILNTIEVK